LALSGLAIDAIPDGPRWLTRVNLNNPMKSGFNYPLASEDQLLASEESLGFSLPSFVFCKLIVDLMCI